MSRRSPCTCRRSGCACPRQPWQLVCDACWKQLPIVLRERYAEVRRLGLTDLKKKIGAELLAMLGRKAVDHAPAVEAYARTAAMLGERDEAAPTDDVADGWRA